MEHPVVVGWLLALYVSPVLLVFGLGAWIAEKLEGNEQ